MFPCLAILLFAVIVAATWSRFAADVRAHRERVRRGSRVVPSPFGPIEVALAGHGAPVLVSHGFAGGFDHVDARPFVDAGFQVIAPSRFGYLRSSIPSDPSPEKQADAFAALLDELGIETVAVVGVSAGAIAALQFAARHPKRCQSLVVIVPPLRQPSSKVLVEPIISNDFGYWLALNLAKSTLIRSVLGTDPFVVDAASLDEQRRAHDLLANVLPIRDRLRGVLDDRRTMSREHTIALDRIEAPALVVSTKDDRHQTLEAAHVLVDRLRSARLVAYRTGGHAWIGHHDKVSVEVLAFLAATTSG